MSFPITTLPWSLNWCSVDLFSLMAANSNLKTLLYSLLVELDMDALKFTLHVKDFFKGRMSRKFIRTLEKSQGQII